MAHDADALVALLDIEVAQVFVAFNGIGNAGGTQMGFAQQDPLGAKFGFCLQQRTEGSSKGGDPSGSFGAHDPLGGNIYQTDIQHGFRRHFRQNFIQNGRMRFPTSHQQISIFFLTQTKGFGIFFQCDFCTHNVPP